LLVVQVQVHQIKALLTADQVVVSVLETILQKITVLDLAQQDKVLLAHWELSTQVAVVAAQVKQGKQITAVQAFNLQLLEPQLSTQVVAAVEIEMVELVDLVAQAAVEMEHLQELLTRAAVVVVAQAQVGNLVVLVSALFLTHLPHNELQVAQLPHTHQAVRHIGFIGLQLQGHSQHDYSQTSYWR
jgi:hypothetical protein